MKRLAVAFAVLGLMLIGLGQKASATTLSPGSDLAVSHVFTDPAKTNVAYIDAYSFSLTTTSNVGVYVFPTFGAISATFTLLGYDSATNTYTTFTPTLSSLGGGATLQSYVGLATNLNYFLTVAGLYTGISGYAGDIKVSATPIPPAILMFVTALGGLGFAGYRRGKFSI